MTKKRSSENFAYGLTFFPEEKKFFPERAAFEVVAPGGTCHLCSVRHCVEFYSLHVSAISTHAQVYSGIIIHYLSIVYMYIHNIIIYIYIYIYILYLYFIYIYRPIY